MKKFKYLIQIFVCLVAIIAMFGNINANTTHAEDSSVIYISSLSEIDTSKDGLNKHYVLTQDAYFDQNCGSTSSLIFTGVLDGNGHTLYQNDKVGYTEPMFSSISDGAVIKNINFGGLSESGSNLSSGGCAYLADTILDSTIENVSFIDCSIRVETEQNHIGFLAAEISNSNISNIKIVNSVITYQYYSCFPDGINFNINVGFIGGKITNGSKVQNCAIENSSINFKLQHSSATSFNFGGIAGVIENATISNNIVNLRKVDDYGNVMPLITFDSDFEKAINFGGIAGIVDFDKNFIYNNVILMEQQTIYLSKMLENSNIGAIFGYMMYELYLTNIEGIITTYDLHMFGGKNSDLYQYEKTVYIPYNELNSLIFTTSQNWNDLEEYKWNYKTIWMNQSNSKLPILQCFETFSASFDADESVKTLSIEQLPKQQVVSANFSRSLDGASIVGNNIAYGEKIYLSISISSQNKYNRFFYVSGLELNGKLVYSNLTGKSQSGFENIKINNDIQQTEGIEGPEQKCVYEISNFNANNAGKYTVILGRNTFKLKVKVFDLGNEETGSVIPGKFKTNSDTNPIEEKIIDLLYGEKYIFNTSVNNTDYSDKAFWYLFDNSQKDMYLEPLKFDPTLADYNYYSNRVEFIFNESCSLFNGDNELVNLTVFDIDNYSEVTLENESVESNYELMIVYTKRVKQINIVLKFDNEEQIKSQIGKILIATSGDNIIWSADRLTWDEELGLLVAKLAFDIDSPIYYLVKLDEVDTSYVFDGWYFEMERLADVENEDYAGSFEITQYTEEPLVIYCVFKSDASNSGANLIWLWILLSVVGVAVITLIIVLIVRKRSGGSSYKKYYY